MGLATSLVSVGEQLYYFGELLLVTSMYSSSRHTDESTDETYTPMIPAGLLACILGQ